MPQSFLTFEVSGSDTVSYAQDERRTRRKASRPTRNRGLRVYF